MSTLEHRLRAEVNVSVDGHQEMAGFEVSINGRFWVSTEESLRRGTSWRPRTGFRSTRAWAGL